MLKIIKVNIHFTGHELWLKNNWGWLWKKTVNALSNYIFNNNLHTCDCISSAIAMHSLHFLYAWEPSLNQPMYWKPTTLELTVDT